MSSLDLAIVLLAISFLGYGLACLFTKHMRAEFLRYGVPQFRILVGSLEVLAGVGLLAGYWLPLVQIIASGGLAVLMFLGCCVRVRIRDSITQIAPAFLFCLLSLYIFTTLWQR